MSQLKMKNKKRITLIAFVVFLTGVVACNDTSVPPPKEQHPIIGTWYEVGSTENIGKKVVFTETTITGFRYYKDYQHYLFPDSLFNDTSFFHYNNTPYEIISESELYMKNLDKYFFPDGKHTTYFEFINDTLFIEHFYLTAAGAVYPNNIAPIYLTRRIANEK